MNYVFDLARHGRLWIARAPRLIIIVDLLRGDLPKVPKERASESRDGCRDCRLRWRRWRRRRRSEASVSTTKKHLRAAVAVRRSRQTASQTITGEGDNHHLQRVCEGERERERERVPICLVLPDRNARRPVEDSATTPEVPTLFKGRSKTISNKLFQRFDLPPKAGNAT